MIETYIQILVNGIIIGSLYALIASGLSLIYNVNKFIHLAHGVTIAISGYLLFWLFGSWNMNFVLASILTVILTGFSGVLMYKVIYAPLIKRKTNNIVILVASFSILFIFENMIQILFGAGMESYDFDSQIYDIFGVYINEVQILIVVLTVLIFIGLWIFLNRTNTGKSIRAVSDNKELAEVLGINVDKLVLMSFFVGSVIAGMGGILIGLEQNLEPNMGMNFIIKGFTGSIVGGFTSIPGAIGGSYIIGLVENVGVWFLPSQFKYALTYIILFVFLLFKPNGIWGVKEREV